MRKTVKVNISGTIFHIDEDGYEILKSYLDKISAHYKNKKGGKEIIDDIEGRIAELFQSKVTATKQVISEEDVKEAIRIMGEPEEIFEEDSETGNVHEEVYEEKTSRTGKRLYRDPENAALGGVCSGLASYFLIDVIWVRVLFIFLFFFNGFGLLLYIILWIVAPPAKTTAQRLEMKGKKVTVSTIEKTIKEEYEHVKKNIKNIKKPNTNKVGEVIEEFFKAMGILLKYLLKFILGIIGFGFLFGGFILLISFIAVFFFDIIPFPDFFDWHHEHHFPYIIDYFIEPGSMSLFMVALFLTISLPLISLIYGGVKLIFRFKANDKSLGTAVFILWLLSAVILVFQLLSEGKNYRSNKTVYQTLPLNNFNGRTLYIEVDDIDFRSKSKTEMIIWDDECRIYIDEETEEVYATPAVDIEKSHSGYYEIVLRKEAFGSNSKNARYNANKLQYNWEMRDSLLVLDPVFAMEEGNKWRFPHLEIIIKVPEGKSVYLSESLEFYLEDVHNVHNTWDEDMISKTWTMKRNGLTIEYDE